MQHDYDYNKWDRRAHYVLMAVVVFVFLLAFATSGLNH